MKTNQERADGYILIEWPESHELWNIQEQC